MGGRAAMGGPSVSPRVEAAKARALTSGPSNSVREIPAVAVAAGGCLVFLFFGPRAPLVARPGHHILTPVVFVAVHSQAFRYLARESERRRILIVGAFRTLGEVVVALRSGQA